MPAMLAMLGATPAGGTTPQTARSPLGVVDHELFDEAAERGVAWMRVPVDWLFVEPEDDTFSFSGAESWLAEMEPRGINMSPVLTIGQFWATGSDELLLTPSNPPIDLSDVFDPEVGYSATYYDFVRHFVANFTGRIDRITVENEVNTDHFWFTGDSPTVAAEKYLRVLTSARMAANDADPSVLVLDSGMGSGSWGAPIAKDRFDSGTYDAAACIAFLRAYYDRDAYVRRDVPEIWTISTEVQLRALFDEVQFNYERVTTILENLWSDDLDRMLVDGLNIKFTGDPWLLEDVVTWIDEKIAAAGQPPVPLKINNEASNWCLTAPYDPDSCVVAAGHPPRLAAELLKKIVFGLHLGVAQSLWFPFSNANVETTVRLGLYDYAAVETDMGVTFQLLARFIGWRHAFERLERLAGGEVLDFVFSDRDEEPFAEDVHVLWWDDGGHGSGAAEVTLEAPMTAVGAWRFTQAGDSTRLALNEGLVNVSVTEAPVIVFFRDLADPVFWELDPLPGPAPKVVVLGSPAPNPSPGGVVIPFGLPERSGAVRLEVFDLAGRRVARLLDGALGAGIYRIRWDGRDDAGRRLGSGVVFARLSAGPLERTTKIVFTN